jgi:uncharacterized membrane protein YvbJ
MKTIKVYVCNCGEDVYEDDIVCVNCGVKTDPGKFREERLVEIKEA